ncbi:MAG: hypothetical protein DRQ45_04495 [Gammaproteobacteria bacterium]|nr:MAG: hypothetical protein DRQ45_04495 [Gammaproteobacteria bacterium]
MPPLTLQPLLENAIYHGIERLPEGGIIHVDGDCQEGRVEITLSNPVPDSSSGQHEGNRIAQENIRQRLQIAYGGHTALSTSLEDGVYTVILEFPEVAVA